MEWSILRETNEIPELCLLLLHLRPTTELLISDCPLLLLSRKDLCLLAGHLFYVSEVLSLLPDQCVLLSCFVFCLTTVCVSAKLNLSPDHCVCVSI